MRMDEEKGNELEDVGRCRILGLRVCEDGG
jgi:hypothetical protein